MSGPESDTSSLLNIFIFGEKLASNGNKVIHKKGEIYANNLELLGIPQMRFFLPALITPPDYVTHKLPM